jgi:hypothetical protein
MLLAGAVELDAVVEALRETRQVFHSEADFQHSFAWVARECDPNIQVRLETRQERDARLDLLLARPDLGRWTAIELKYLTAKWAGECAGEEFTLREQGAQDLSTYDVIKDVTRVERFVAGREDWNGAVLVLSNDPTYWKRPRHPRETNAHAFRLHEGNVMSGVRTWGPQTGFGTRKGREADLSLRDEYRCAWSDYSSLEGERGLFRLLVLQVAPTR